MRKTYKYKNIRLIGGTKNIFCVYIFFLETCGTVRNMYMNLQLQNFVKCKCSSSQLYFAMASILMKEGKEKIVNE